MNAHAHLLLAPGSLDPRTGPLILERTEQEFLPALLDELARPGGLDAARESLARTRDADNTLTLYQPVHRTFHIALFEVCCDELPYGLPRLDARKVESAGLVVRRQGIDRRGVPLTGVWEGWRYDGAKRRGWLPLRAAAEENQDPDPARRPARTLGHAELDRRRDGLRTLTLSEREAGYEESVSPLFVAPPRVCEAVGKTLLYAVIPVTSSEVSENEAAPDLPAFTPDEVKAHLSPYLQATPQGATLAVPRAGQTLTFAAAKEADDDPESVMGKFVGMLRQAVIEFDAFGNGIAPAQLRAALNAVPLRLGSGDDAQDMPLGQWLQAAAQVLVLRDEGVSVLMPLAWPAVGAAQAGAVADAALGAMTARLTALLPPEGRFDAPDRRYSVRAFVRVRRDDGCPPELVWSEPSELFSIAPWYAAGNAPPMQIALPDPFDPKLRANRPSVAFALPKSLFDMAGANSLKGAADGDVKKGGSGLALGWLCSFNIPFITICAFLVLNIFLSLFDIVFRWMLFIKICIPIPKRK